MYLKPKTKSKKLIYNGRVYQQHYGGSLKSFFSKLGKQFVSSGKKLAKQALDTALVAGKESASQLVPQLTNLAGQKALEYASKKGAPDFLVNQGSKLVQKGSKSLGQAIKGEEAPLTKTQTQASDFITQQSQDIIQKLLSKRQQGKGVYGLGKGVKNFGSGSRNFGSGIYQADTPRI